ncbi:tetratricopeptide repeat protein [Aspergillus lucknowensis]|uniref:MYND-type domain-containing protein n=1 Tax=Aspergillus lucknowensis TaxID=176173 RepID=A0ABR4M449_9EURO
MAMEIVHYANIAGARQSKHHLPNDAKGDLEKDIILNTSNRLEGKTRILRASDVLLSIAGRSITNETREPTPAVENFQEVLRLFPPFRDDDGAILGALDVKCPDCDAVFSSSNELNQHYLTRYCAGTAVAVYVMMRDRLITKGYRMEKRLIPLDSRPIRFFCSECEKPFSLSEDGQIIERQRNTACFLDCTHCGSKCNILYEPILNDPRDDTNYRDIHKEISSANHSRSPSLVQKSSMASKFSVTDFNSEQSLAKKARKLRDSWSFRKMSQSDEEELLAMSFAGLYDLEKAHAPNGMYQPLPTDTGVGVSDSSFCSDGMLPGSQTGYRLINHLAFCLSSVIEPLREDESQRQRSDVSNSEGGLVDDSRNVEYDTPKTSKRQSFFQKLFGRKIKTSISRSRSTSGRGKKLMKRANTIRFSFVTKYRSESRATGHESPEASEEALTQETDSQNNSSTTVQDAEYVTLLRGTQNIFVHLQYLSGGAIVHDASGRQRILQVDEIARLFLQIRDELTSTTVWSRALTAKLRAEALLRQGHPQAAVVEFHEAMKILDDMPGLDTEKQTRAAILHSLGHAYRDLDLPAESEACYLEALGLYKRVLGRDHPKNFAVIHDLGSLCERDGYATEAAALYERSFAGRLKTLGHNAPETLSSMQDLASLKVLLGDLESALLLLKKAVPALDTVFGIQNATTLNAMNKLSLLYQKLRLEKESRTICGRTIPHCRTVFGLSSPVTRDAVVRYIQSSDNFDFPPDIKDVLDGYRRSRDPDCLRVIHRLGRAYMDAGLNRDAATLFEALVEDFLAVKGPDAPETFDALSALCVTREHLDALDKAILAYKQLVHMASRTPEHHHSRKRIGYAEKRISELNRRREILESERKEWELNDAKSCENCGHSTVLLCSKCNIARFCSDTCLKQASLWHTPHCIPSVSLRESKSLAVKPKCPPSARDQALSKISHYNGLTGIGMKDIVITASYTFYLDPRNFTTFRMKLKDNVNTVFLFSLDSDVQYTVVTGNPPPPPPPSQQRPESKGMGKLSIPRPTTSSNNKKHTQHNHPKQPEERTWITPQSQDFVSHAPLPRPSLLSQAPHSLPHHLGMGPTGPPPPPSNPKTSPGATPAPGGETYILIKPGKEMHKSLIEKRIAVRAGPGDTERDLFAGLDSPNKELIEYAQGLLLTGYLGEVVVYVIEWVWK